MADIKNEVAKQLVIKMREASLADKTVVNYFQVVKAVVASAVSSEGEQLHPRNWNFHFIGLPVIDEKKQRKPSFTAREVEQILARAKGRYKVLFALLAGTGLRIGEAFGLRLGEHLSGDRDGAVRCGVDADVGSFRLHGLGNDVDGVPIAARRDAL